MKCPYCVEEGKVSRVRIPSSCVTTCMADEQFYDESGTYHRHDPNTSTSELSCSQGHRWVVSAMGKCPGCDYGKGGTVTRRIP